MGSNKAGYTRLHQIDEEIRRNHYPTREELARKFETTPRTIQRDICD